jgi:uncharacterized protein (DUF486 family)
MFYYFSGLNTNNVGRNMLPAHKLVTTQNSSVLMVFYPFLIFGEIAHELPTC